MLDKLFSKPIELVVGDQTLRFHSLIEFEFALNGRTSIPAGKISDLVKFSVSQLKKEAHTIKEVEKRFVTLLSQSIEDPEGIGRAIQELDPIIFSHDHGWREIIAALNKSEDDINEFRRIAIVKYMQYLSARQEIIKYLYSERSKITPDPPLPEESAEGDMMKTTVILDSTVIGMPVGKEEGNDDDMTRMPKGEAVTINLMPGKEVDIFLSKHECKLKGGDQLEFIDQSGQNYALKDGRNVVGRDAVSTIRMDQGLRDISRLHLVIEKHGNNQISLTDLSSHGTYLPLKFIAEHSNTV
ncbi:MAG: FHA domain-containing protein [Thiotrichales bacterium]|nr:FHA domain-containing protein [Thiotrichales bacterium]